MLVIAAVMAAAVPVVHEEVHQRTCGKEQIGQSTEDMRRVLGDQEEARDRQEAAEYEPGLGAPPGRLGSIIHAPRSSTSASIVSRPYGRPHGRDITARPESSSNGMAAATTPPGRWTGSGGNLD
jgi:hypothetical protein